MASSAWGFNTAGIASATSPGLVQAGGYNVLPAGTVLPYAGGTAPAGFVFCDGAEISKTTYPQLYAAIADAYATQTNPTTGALWLAPSASNFRVPDYRGSFLRGVGTANLKDATTLGGYQGEKTKTPASSFTTAAQTVTGTVGGTDGGHSHTGGFVPLQLSGSNSGNTNSASAGSGSGGTTNFVATIGSASSTHGHGHSLTSPSSTVNGGGDNETRPLNKGVNYIIKY
jgi:hypothetical protein